MINKLFTTQINWETNLIQPLLANVVELVERVEAGNVHLTVRAQVEVHQVRRILGGVCDSSKFQHQ